MYDWDKKVINLIIGWNVNNASKKVRFSRNRVINLIIGWNVNKEEKVITDSGIEVINLIIGWNVNKQDTSYRRCYKLLLI